MNVYQLTQRYPQIKLRNTPKTSGKIMVSRGNLCVSVKSTKRFYRTVLHELCHFIVADEDKLLEPNLGMPLFNQGAANKWQRKASTHAVREAAYNELRVNALMDASGIQIKGYRKTRHYPRNYEAWWVSFHRGFPEFNRAQLLQHLCKTHYQYMREYNKKCFFAELERRLELIA